MIVLAWSFPENRRFYFSIANKYSDFLFLPAKWKGNRPFPICWRHPHLLFKSSFFMEIRLYSFKEKSRNFHLQYYSICSRLICKILTVRWPTTGKYFMRYLLVRKKARSYASHYDIVETQVIIYASSLTKSVKLLSFSHRHRWIACISSLFIRLLKVGRNILQLHLQKIILYH